LGIGGHVSAGATIAAFLLALPLIVLAREGIDWRWLVLLGVFGLVPAVDLSVALVNHAVTQSFRAMLLPALAIKEGVPAHLRTLIAVPATDFAEIDRRTD
jgi:cyclic beta-1,2-glucan synthetase